MRKKICIILIIVLFINTININVLAMSYPGVQAGTQKEDKEEKKDTTQITSNNPLNAGYSSQGGTGGETQKEDKKEDKKEPTQVTPNNPLNAGYGSSVNAGGGTQQEDKKEDKKEPTQVTPNNPLNAGYGSSVNAGGGTQQEIKPPTYSTGDPTNPGKTPNYVVEDKVIKTKEELQKALQGYVKEGTLELNSLGKQESSLKQIEQVLKQVPEETLKEWYEEDGKETFNQYSALVGEVDRGLNQNSNLQDRIDYMDKEFEDWKDIVSSNNATSGSMTESPQEEPDEEEQDKTRPQGPSTGILGNADASASHTLDKIIQAAKDFLNKGNSVTTIEGDNVKAASSTLYNILLSIGIFLSVGVGMYLGVKFMVSTAEDKAKVKESLIPYIAGCVVIFSAFVIWKAVILLLGGIG